MSFNFLGLCLAYLIYIFFYYNPSEAKYMIWINFLEKQIFVPLIIIIGGEKLNELKQKLQVVWKYNKFIVYF